MKRLPPKMIDDGGASNGQTLVYNSTTKRWAPATPAAIGSIDALTDVDTSTAPPTNGQALTYDSASALWKPATVGGGSGTGGWSTDVDLPLTSLTNWTAGAGTWTAQTDRIRQSVTTSTAMRLHYNPVVPLAHTVAQVDIRIDSSVSTTSSRAGIIFGTPRSSDGGGGLLVALAAGAATQTTGIHTEVDAVANAADRALTTAINHGTWMTLRVRKIGETMDVYLNGTLLTTIFILHGASSFELGRLALNAWGADVSFRNLKLWSPTLPA